MSLCPKYGAAGTDHGRDSDSDSNRVCDKNRIRNTDTTNTNSNGNRKKQHLNSTLPAGGIMPGSMGDASHLLQKQHETVLLVVKSYKMWVSDGGLAYRCTCTCTYSYRHIMHA